jgi:hypothetical protein
MIYKYWVYAVISIHESNAEDSTVVEKFDMHFGVTRTVTVCDFPHIHELAITACNLAAKSKKLDGEPGRVRGEIVSWQKLESLIEMPGNRQLA